jgi:chemotaxis response regulator CheB
LTGMGRDGAAGLLALHRRGMYTVAQERASCAVYGMPKAAVDLGAATAVLPIERIARALTARIEKAAAENAVKGAAQ